MNERVVVVLNPDGFVEVYSSSQVSAIVINRPVTNSVRTFELADELIEEVLPAPYKDVMWPGNRVAVGELKEVTTTSMKVNLFRLAVIGTNNLSSHKRRILALLGGDYSGRVNTCPLEERLREEAELEAAG